MRAGDCRVVGAIGVAIVMLLSALFPPPAAPAPRVRASAAPAALTAHAPIYIDGNAGFNATNGVTAGNGTAASPYIIEGWDLTPLDAHGIELYNTTAYAIVRNLVVQGQSPAYVGVFLWGASNVTVENVTATGSAQGIYLYQASHVTIRACTAPYHDGGSVAVYESDHVLVDANDGGYANVGVSIRYSSSVNVTNNRISNVTEGFDVEVSTGVTISGNRVVNGSPYGFIPAGILVAGSNGTVITGNDVAGLPRFGIRVDNSTGILMEANHLDSNGIGAAFLTATGTVSHNRFFFNLVQSVDSLGNTWNATYPTGGNYWSDYGGVDRCRGPAQADCSAGDGIGDTPYVANGSIRDRYPFMFYDLPPRVTVDGPASVLAEQRATFRAVVFDPYGTVTSVAWAFGDGGAGSGESVDHVYADSGTFRLQVVLTDNRSLSAWSNASITVWPAVAFVSVSHSSGFQLPVPAVWETHTDYAVGGSPVPVVSFGPTDNGFRTNLLVTYADDPSPQETPAYLSAAVNGTLAEVRQSEPGAYLLGGLRYLTVSGHAAVDFTVTYSSASFLQRAVLVVSAAHGRDWLLLLSTSMGSSAQMNATFDAIVAGFTITALPTWVVVAIVGAVLGAAAAGIAFVVLRIRKRRAARPKVAAPPPPNTAAVTSSGSCAQCGASLPDGGTFCGNCGARVGGPPPGS